MLDLEAREIIEGEYSTCERCGEETLAEEMNSAYAFNGFETWGEALYSECWDCSTQQGY